MTVLLVLQDESELLILCFLAGMLRLLVQTEQRIDMRERIPIIPFIGCEAHGGFRMQPRFI